MAIQIAWDDERQDIIRVRVEGRWTWDDLEAALGDTIRMMDSVTHVVHFIIDIRGSHLNVGGALAQAQKAATPATHRNEGVKVVVGANRVARMLYGTYRKLNSALGKNQEFHFADSIEDAYEYIERKTGT